MRPPDNMSVRPTADRVREAWMSIVLPAIPGAIVLDCFAGSGALGLEALSRGAEAVHFVESSAKVLQTLRANVEALGAQESVRVHRADALRFIAGLQAGAYDVAFADPPYRTDLARRVAEAWLAVPFAAILGVEHASGEEMPEGDTRRYGDSAITFYRTE